jgi:hypothetical protein
MKNFLRLSAASAVMLWADVAFASCGLHLPWSPPCPSAPSTSVPEIDGSAGIMAMALVASVAALIYNRAKR